MCPTLETERYDWLRELEEQVRILRAENDRLAEGREDALLLGLLSEQVGASRSVSDAILGGLERIATLKQIPFCAFGRWSGGALELEESYAPGIEESGPASPIVLTAAAAADLAVGACLLRGEEACVEAGVRLGARSFVPRCVLLVSSECRGMPRCVFLFADDASPDRLGYAVEVLSRAADAVAARVSSLALLHELWSLANELDLKVAERTQALRQANERLEREIAERKRQEELLVRTQRMESLAALAGGIAHDFNNLLTGVLGNVSLARAERLPAFIDELLVDAERAAGRARGLTHQLLTFARGGAPVKKVVALQGIVRDAATFSTHGSPVVCTFDLDPALWPAEVDAGQLAQIVQNLVLNAVEATPGGGTVRIRAENATLPGGNERALPPGPYVRLGFSDQGVGIPQELLDRIFDPFFSTKKRGSGLGLSVCQAIVAKHGGWMGVTSAAGAGTTFEVFLPARPTATLREEAAAVAKAALRGRVLVMDDDELVRRSTGRMLERLGVEVVTAAEGGQAIGMFRQAIEEGRRYDVVILDLTVRGGMGGAEAWRVMREIDPSAIGIVASGYATGTVMTSPEEHGFSKVLEKPFGPEELRAALQPILGAPRGA